MRDTMRTLLKLIEECAEVQQAAIKVMDFGAYSKWPDANSPSNLEHLTLELGDLLAIIEVLRNETTLDIDPDKLNVAKANKMKKLEIYLPVLS
jgi:NTP pyrophosphatase (non-canonical NTP hydrolase)